VKPVRNSESERRLGTHRLQRAGLGSPPISDQCAFCESLRAGSDAHPGAALLSIGL